MKTKVLVLGGASVHVKLVHAAHALGLYVIVADYLDVNQSPAKLVADEHWLVSIRDIDELESLARAAGVKAVLSTHLDPGQRPYQELCERLGLPCYGTGDSFFKMTDKIAFKKLCRENGVGTIKEYSLSDIEKGCAEFPLFIKPTDSRGSRGQSICWTRDEAIAASEIACRESSNGECIIEQYVENAQEVQITYFVVDGEAHLIRMADSYKGRHKGMEKVVSCAVSPSRHVHAWLEHGESNVRELIRSLGIQYGPFFMQGFFDGKGFRFFDPGLRFPGVDYELIYKRVFGIDLLVHMWEYALTGKMPGLRMPEDSWNLKGRKSAILFPAMKAGVIERMEGVDGLAADPEVVAYSLRHGVGDVVGWSYDVNQRFGEIDILCDDENLLNDAIERIQHDVFPVDREENSLALEHFNLKQGLT